MKDTIRALLGPNYCDWCDDHGATWWDRAMRFDVAMKTSDRPIHEKLAMKMQDFTDWLGIWKLGQKWHFGHHKDPHDQ